MAHTKSRLDDLETRARPVDRVDDEHDWVVVEPTRYESLEECLTCGVTDELAVTSHNS